LLSMSGVSEKFPVSKARPGAPALERFLVRKAMDREHPSSVSNTPSM
jgi:hypothetical protein